MVIGINLLESDLELGQRPYQLLLLSNLDTSLLGPGGWLFKDARP